MSSFVNGRRVFAALIFPLTILAVYGSYYENRSVSRASASSDQDFFLAAKFTGRDAATDAVRSESTVLTRIPVGNAVDREAAARVGKIVEDYGAFVLVAKNRGIEAKGFSLDEQEVETTINLPGAQFDPVKQPPQGSLRLGAAATANGKGYYILQFGGTATDEWLKSVRGAGVQVLQYISHQAYFVYGDGEAIARVANHKRVRWIGQYNADQKSTPVFRAQLNSAMNGALLARGISQIEMTKKGAAVFDVAVFARADLDAVAADLKNRFGQGPTTTISRLRHNFFNLVRLELRFDDIDDVAAMSDVVGLEPVEKSRNEDERANQIIAGNYFNTTTIQGSGYNPASQFGADGTDVTVSVVDDGVGIPGDGGFYITSSSAVNGPLRGAQPGALGHGHFNATIIAGSTPYGPLDSLFYNYGLGVAPKAHIVNIPRNRTGYSATDVEVYNDSVITPGPNGLHPFISNNSWGNGTNGNSYGIMERTFDGIAQDASFDSTIDPIALVFSAGNDGSNGLTKPKVAKNVIAVGNSESLRTDKGGSSANNIDDIAADSSRGPAADGRIKPDIVAPGTAITGGRSGFNTLSGNIDSAHRWSSGTSHSAANISGVAAVFTQWWRDRRNTDNPSPSVIKAALINSATDMNGENSSAPIPNASEGWGRPNMKTMLTPGVGMKYIDEEVPLTETGAGYPIRGSVADGSKPVRVTLVWTDPPGTADPALVNNLDLIVTVGNVVYKGNVFSNGVSVAGGTADTRNNVENVFLPAGIPTGTYLEVEARPTALNGDGILFNGDDTDQSYSLVIHNYSGIISPSFFTLSGRIVSASQRGIGRAKVRLTDNQGISREVLSNPLGYFAFTDLPGGQTYTLNVTSKSYTFAQRNVVVTGNTFETINSNSGP